MKKFLLLLLVSVVFGAKTELNAQASCPVITRYFINQVGVNTYNILFYFYNPTNGVKYINVTVSGLTPTPATVSLGCYDASGQANVIRNYTTPNFVTTNFGALTMTITSYTGNVCGGSACATSSFSNIPLPVNLKSFNANRNKSNVSLVWETTTESNNKGFQVQRKVGTNEFTTIAFVNTKAKAGNSESDLSYSFTDVNTLKGVSQYRLLQEDFDGQSKYSDTRSIKGEEQSTKTIVFPNPSTNGTVNVVFEDTRSIRDIQLMDMNGRVVNQWRNQTSNNIKIDNLVPGFYNLRVVDQTTKEQSIEKIIIR